MKKSFLFCLMALFLFSCNRDQLTLKKAQLQNDNIYKILTKEAITEAIALDALKGVGIDPETNEPISRDEVLFKESLSILTACDDLDVKVFRTEDVDGCCMFTVRVYHKDYKTGPVQFDLDIFIDGVFHSGHGTGVVGVSFPVELCDGPRLVELYSGGILCFSETLTCDDETCCSELDYNITVYQDGECCVYELIINDPTDCFENQYAFNYNSDVGYPDTYIWTDTGVIVHICDPEQRIRFVVWEDTSHEEFCYVSSWYTNNDCKY